MERILVSACLLGEPCRYDAVQKPCRAVQDLAATYELIPVCPEQLGGLPTPRVPAEIQPDGSILNRNGVDVSKQYRAGAQAALQIARENGCTCAILKTRSPSCGVHEVYDGSFSGTLIPGRGIAAAAMAHAGIEVSDETEWIERANSNPTRVEH